MPKPKGVARLILPKRPLWNVALAVDWQGDDDGDITIVTAGACMEWLVEIFTSLCASASGIARGFRIESQLSPMWRNGYVNTRLAVILDGCRRDMLTPESLLLIVKIRMERYVNGGHVDCYRLDDLLNLSHRRPERIITPQPVASAPEPVKNQRRRKSQGAPMDAEPVTQQEEPKENKDEMANIYLRVPWYVAAYYRGREEDHQLTEWQPVEFADYSREFMIMENGLRYLPEQAQSHICYSQTAWNNILHGRRPDGGEVIIRRDPKEWPDTKEICTLIGKANHGRQSSSEYLAIKMPREVYFNKHVHRTNQTYCLAYDVAVWLSSELMRQFCYEYLEWTEYRKEFVRRQLGRKPKTNEIVEMFFTQFNFPPSILPTERESLRRMHTRWISSARKRPAYHYQFDDTTFLEHISDDERRRAEQHKKK